MRRWRLTSKTIAFTNGVFDILHEGHLKIICAAAATADILIIGINSDASVRKLKGPGRPVQNENSRALILASLLVVDAVIIFDEDTPLNLIRAIQPNVLIKGGDYTMDTIVGADVVSTSGGEVLVVPLEPGHSTTALINKMQQP